MAKRLLNLAKSLPKISNIKPPFIFKEVNGEKAVQSFFDVLDGKIGGVHLKSVLSKEYCEGFEKRFHSSPIRQLRPDGVPAYEVGVTQWNKRPSILAKLSYNQHGHIRDLLGDYENPIMYFYRQVALKGTDRNIIIRPATYGAESMPIVRAIQWNKANPGHQVLLEFHDDIAQCKAKMNEGFEIQDAEKVIALNFYTKCQKGSGQLAVVDWQPTDNERDELGLSEVGYPYTEENIPKNTKRHLFNQETGDVIIMDGSFAHSVIVGNDECPARLVVNGFAALLKNNTIILYS
jgi:hypothetical protein